MDTELGDYWYSDYQDQVSERIGIGLMTMMAIRTVMGIMAMIVMMAMMTMLIIRTMSTLC